MNKEKLQQLGYEAKMQGATRHVIPHGLTPEQAMEWLRGYDRPYLHDKVLRKHKQTFSNLSKK